MSNPIRVLVVDDSTFMRGALVRMIEKNPRFKVIDVACNGREGVDKAIALRPDVVTMDVEMPIMSGIEALTEIMHRAPMPVVMVSTLTEAGASTTMKALEIGAVDFIPKSLQDKDKNIFRGAEVIHEKLEAAAQARVSGGRRVVANPVLTPTAAVTTPLAVAKPVVSRSIMAGVDRIAAKMVVIGSSTGGPRALLEVLKCLPHNFPLPVVVAQHMPPNFTEALANRLDETCPIKVVQAQAGDMPAAGTVYIAPGGKHMRLEADGRLSIRDEQGESPYKPSVDVLAESVAKIYGRNVLGVMLTGMGNDGTRAFKELKVLGAHLIAQNEETCVVYGMPKAAVEAGAASDVLAIEDIGRRVCGLVGAVAV